MTESTAIDVAPAIALPEIRRLINKLSIEASLPSETGGGIDVQLDILESILAAESEEEVFERQTLGGISSKDYVNIPFRLRSEGIDWKRSAFQGSKNFPYFMLLHVVEMGSGEEKVITAGGVTTVGVMARLQELDSFAAWEPEGKPLMFVSKTAMSGYDYLLVQPVKLPEQTKQSTKRRG